MAGNDALLASLLLGQKQRRDPLEIYQAFGRDQIKAGSSTAPLGSGNPLEGIARALQAGVGGLVQNYAIGKQEEDDASTLAGLTKAATETTNEGIANALSGIKGNASLLVPLFGQILQSRIDQNLAQQNAAPNMGPLGIGAAAATAPAAAPMPQGGGAAPPGGINTAALPPPGIPQPGYAFANNSGNIRASSIPWEGKGPPQNGFETFDSPQSGVNAHFKNFAAYVQANPNITVAQALAKWAPSTENDTAGYIKGISEATGINPGMPMAEVLKDPAMAAQLLDAQTRREKGGLPQGYSADTFTQAAGGPQAAPGQPGPVAAPPAQGSGPAAVNQGPPVAANTSPAGDPYRRVAEAYAAQGDTVKATEFAQKAIAADSEWAKTVGVQNIQQAGEAARHERDIQEKKANPVYTQEQNLSHTYATRLNNAIPQLEKLVQDQKNIPSWSEQIQADSPYYPEPLVSDKAKEFRRITKDITSGLLRRESGASIHSGEYVTEYQKFIPQPGDSPELVANKLSALKQAGRAIAEGTGRPVANYSALGGLPAAGSAGGTPQAPAAASGATGAAAEGATATNPQTGQKVILRGGQWVPVQ